MQVHSNVKFIWVVAADQGHGYLMFASLEHFLDVAFLSSYYEEQILSGVGVLVGEDLDYKESERAYRCFLSSVVQSSWFFRNRYLCWLCKYALWLYLYNNQACWIWMHVGLELGVLVGKTCDGFLISCLVFRKSCKVLLDEYSSVQETITEMQSKKFLFKWRQTQINADGAEVELYWQKTCSCL